MALAQVVYQISTDADFAAKMKSDPEVALSERGWSLTKEELAFLVAGISRRALGKDQILTLVERRGLRWW